MICVHEHNIIHRDLKPGNFLFDSGHLVKICGLASSRFEELNVTVTTGAVELLYFPPELVDGVEDPTNKVDVYAFGLILYEIVFAGIHASQDVKNRLKKATFAGRRPPVDGIPHLAATLIQDCWKDNPNDRPSFSEIMRRICQHDFEIVDDVNPREVGAFYEWIQREKATRESV
jgi:serine/threonine protein kinase